MFAVDTSSTMKHYMMHMMHWMAAGVLVCGLSTQLRGQHGHGQHGHGKQGKHSHGKQGKHSHGQHGNHSHGQHSKHTHGQHGQHTHGQHVQHGHGGHGHGPQGHEVAGKKPPSVGQQDGHASKAAPDHKAPARRPNIHQFARVVVHHRPEARAFLRKSGTTDKQLQQFEALVRKAHLQHIDLHAAEAKAKFNLAWVAHVDDADEHEVLQAVDAWTHAQAASRKHAVRTAFAARRILGEVIWKKVHERMAAHLHAAHQHARHQHARHQHARHQHARHQHARHQHEAHQHKAHQHEAHEHGGHQGGSAPSHERRAGSTEKAHSRRVKQK